MFNFQFSLKNVHGYSKNKACGLLRSAMALVYKMAYLVAGVLVNCIVGYGTL